ncbi:hypothetical protein D3C76_1638940 [compost metagenome]
MIEVGDEIKGVEDRGTAGYSKLHEVRGIVTVVNTVEDIRMYTIKTVCSNYFRETIVSESLGEVQLIKKGVN